MTARVDSKGKAFAHERSSCSRYRTNQRYRQAALARGHARQLKARVIHNPSAYLLRRYNLEDLAEALGLQVVERKPKEANLTLDYFVQKSYRPPAESGSQAAA